MQHTGVQIIVLLSRDILICENERSFADRNDLVRGQTLTRHQSVFFFF